MNLRRIVLGSPGWPPGAFPNGIVTYVGNLRPALMDHGFVAHVLAGSVVPATADPEISDQEALSRTRTPPVKVVDRFLHWAVRERSLPLRWSHELRPAVQHLVRNYPFELLEFEESFGMARYLTRWLRVPVVIRLHGPWFLNGPALGVPEDQAFQRRVTLEGIGIARAAAVTAPSRHVLDQVRNRYQLPLPEAQVIPNPGPPTHPTGRWSLTDCQRDHLLFVGRFDRHKGGDLAIDAFAMIAREFPSAVLLFVGPDRGLLGGSGRKYNLASYLEERLPDVAVRRRIQVLGTQTRPTIDALRRRAFLTLVPSRYENFPMTVVEALSAGSPLVTSDAGGIPEIVRDGETALTFHSGDAAHLAARIRQLLNDPSLAATLGDRGQADYQVRFTPEVVARAMAVFYQKVLADRARSPRRDSPSSR